MTSMFNFSWLATLYQQTVVQWFTAFYITAIALIFLLGMNGMPVQLAGDSPLGNALLFIGGMVFYLMHIALIYLMTRRRPLPDWHSRAPARKVAIQQTIWLWVYAMMMLIILGNGFNIGLHLPGTIFDPDYPITAQSTIIWAVANFVIFAAIPYTVFRWMGYSNQALSLRTSNWRADLVILVVVLVVESLIEWFGIPDGMRFFNLTGSQMVLGGSLTLIIHLIGTGIPIMIFIQSILIPRYYKISGSLTVSVIAGGISYATFHIFEFWTIYDSTTTATILSLLFVYLQFTGAGMVKAMLTLRTGNAWVHVWAYHVIAPHLWTDTNLIVNAFRIR
ncbi:MAG: hypothetical protein AAF629_08415 [Chloroflexota bacterium]